MFVCLPGEQCKGTSTDNGSDTGLSVVLGWVCNDGKTGGISVRVHISEYQSGPGGLQECQRTQVTLGSEKKGTPPERSSRLWKSRIGTGTLYTNIRRSKSNLLT